MGEDKGSWLESAFKGALGATKLAENFVLGLATDGDDWTFVVKAHALLETALTRVLVADLQRPGLEDFISQLDMSDYRRGKARMAEALLLIDKRERSFVLTLSTLRNRLVHNIKNTGFEFKPRLGLAEESDSAVREAALDCVKAAAPFLPDRIDDGIRVSSQAEFLENEPRLAIWFGVHWVMCRSYHATTPMQSIARALAARAAKGPGKGPGS